MLIANEPLFLKRTANIYGNQRKRATKDYQQLGYTLEELRCKAREAVTCCYCGVVLTTESLSLDHRKPISRGGSWALENLTVVCLRCNHVKGCLNHEEFGALMAVILRLSPQAQTSVLSRLRAGAVRIYARGKR